MRAVAVPSGKLRTLLAASEELDTLRSELAKAREALKPQPVKITTQAWEDGEWVVCINGEPCGQTIHINMRRDIVGWLGSAWADLLKANHAAALAQPAQEKQP
jgi:hypothetical protein